MKLKLWLRNLSISAPRVAVRTQLPWAFRVGLLLLAVALCAAGLLAVYQYARSVSAPGRDDLLSELNELRGQLRRATDERERLAAQAVQMESQLKVERAMQEPIAAQMKALADDNARLRGDLAFFESLLPAQSSARGLLIRSFKVQPDVDDATVRYRLLVQQSGKPQRDFVGKVLLKVSLQKDGRPLSMQLPDPALPAAGPAPLSFRHYQRIEGSFALPPGATITSVQVTIESGGETRAQQTFAM